MVLLEIKQLRDKKEYEKAQDKIKEQELKIAILEDLLKKTTIAKWQDIYC